VNERVTDEHVMDERVMGALARVFGSGRPIGDVVRADTPLSALGPIDQAWPLVIAALDDVDVRLGDDDVLGVVTVGDLERAVTR
jgi:hypothetical protein